MWSTSALSLGTNPSVSHLSLVGRTDPRVGGTHLTPVRAVRRPDDVRRQRGHLLEQRVLCEVGVAGREPPQPPGRRSASV
jgi:hypothetical protein